MYNKVSAADIAKLQEIVGQTDVLVGEAISPDYAHDELGGISQMPEVLVRVRSTQEVSSVMKLAFDRTIPVTVRGSGKGYFVVRNERKGDVVARIPVTPGAEWHDCAGELTIASGKHPLYFTFEGDGALDFKAFCLK